MPVCKREVISSIKALYERSVKALFMLCKGQLRVYLRKYA